MKIFLRNLLIFSLPFIVFVLFFEVYLRTIHTSYSEKINGLLKDKDTIELLILGNSHSAYGINPNRFDLYSYNMGQVTQSLYFDKRITLAHLDEFKKLKYVLIEIDFHSLCFSSQTKMRDVMSYYGYGVSYRDQIPTIVKYSKLYGYSRKLAFNFLKKDWSNKYKTIKAIDVEEGVNLEQPIHKGWFSFKEGSSDFITIESCKERANYFNDLVHKSKERDTIVSDLEDFISQLKRKHIQPILVSTPCYKPYRDLLDKKILSKNTGIINGLCKKYKVEYWNYFDLNLDKNCYFNCDHLNYKGANAFSTILNLKLNGKS